MAEQDRSNDFRVQNLPARFSPGLTVLKRFLRLRTLNAVIMQFNGDDFKPKKGNRKLKVAAYKEN